ncbi:MAG: D-2-hydroxyacid dehydrogenase [Planctomycetes bacterium]|nr:D-2-hydroxyacid dehydrogenase [Planctomycetota bacterium]
MRIVLCYPVQPRHVAQIKAAAPDAEIVDAGQERIAEELLAADVFCGHAKVPVPWSEVVQRGRLRWIQSTAAGLDHCLTSPVIDSAIVVTGASGLFANQVAEHTVALLTGVLRNLPTFFRAALERDFTRQPTRDLHGATIGIIGFGGNGRRIAEVLSVYNTRILATDMFPRNKPNWVTELLPADRLDDFLPMVDAVILCVPLTNATRGMMNRSTLRKMKPGSVLINVARGPVVVEADLIEALKSGHLSAAGLDVTEVEPLPKDSELWDLPNVIITPHVGAQSASRIDDTTDFFCENLRRYYSDEPLLNLVDKQLGFPVPSASKGSESA